MKNLKLVPFKRYNGTTILNYLKLQILKHELDLDADALLKQKQVFVNGFSVSVPHYYISSGDYIEISGVEIELHPPEYDVIYQDEALCCIDKKEGTHSVDSIHGVKWPIEDRVRWNITTKERPNPFVAAIHRLDVDTSGVLVLATKQEVASTFGKVLQERKTEKTYLAVVSPPPQKDEFQIDAPIGYDTARPGLWASNGKNSKEALTHFKVLERTKSYTLLKCIPKTGRTHQIRAHLSGNATPIVGDTLYNGENYSRLMLHCNLMIFHGISDYKNKFESSVPEIFYDILQ